MIRGTMADDPESQRVLANLWRRIADVSQEVGFAAQRHCATTFRALASESWHYAQHACFLATGLAFWWPVVRPWPSRAAAPRGAIVLYLVLADLQNTVLSAWLVFAERVLYPSYAANPRPWEMTGLDDQAAAGAIMWVPGSIAFLLPTAWIVGQMLSPQAGPAARSGFLRGGRVQSPRHPGIRYPAPPS